MKLKPIRRIQDVKEGMHIRAVITQGNKLHISTEDILGKPFLHSKKSRKRLGKFWAENKCVNLECWKVLIRKSYGEHDTHAYLTDLGVDTRWPKALFRYSSAVMTKLQSMTELEFFLFCRPDKTEQDFRLFCETNDAWSTLDAEAEAYYDAHCDYAYDEPSESDHADDEQFALKA